MTEAIKIKNLKKTLWIPSSIKGLNFAYSKKFLLAGVNGAGKTTCMECLEGLRKPDSGEITINGKMEFNYNRLLVCASQAFEAVKLLPNA